MAVGRASGPAPLVTGLGPTRPHFVVSPSLTLGKTLMNFFQLITDLLILAGAKGQGRILQRFWTFFHIRDELNVQLFKLKHSIIDKFVRTVSVGPKLKAVSLKE